VGFVNGEGSFHIKIAVSKTNIIGYAIRLKFSIGQHSRDFELLSSFTRASPPPPLEQPSQRAFSALRGHIFFLYYFYFIIKKY
jgi:hypothetical protein